MKTLAFQLFPYPHHLILKWSFRLSILFYRLSLAARESYVSPLN